MAKAELGEKQVCPNCGAKFYDLRKRPATCPKCATAFDPADETIKLKRTRTRTPSYETTYDDDEAKPRVAADGEDDDEEVEEVTPEIDAEDAETVVSLEDDEEGAVPSDELPPGFSEDEADLEDETSAEDEIPTIEDEEEFSDDDLALPGEDED